MNYKLRRFFRNFAIENIMTYIAATMGLVYVGDLFTNYMLTSWLYFDRAAILSGQVWRLVTFLFMPQSSGIFWVVISVYFYYFIGKEVENDWGSHELTLYLLTGYAMLLAIGLLTGYTDASYLYFSLLLVFAALRPHQIFRLFMIVPVEAKWIAVIDSIYMLWEFAAAFLFYLSAPRLALGIQLSVLAGFATYAIFFGKPIINRIRNRRKHRDFINQMRQNDMTGIRRDEEDD